MLKMSFWDDLKARRTDLSGFIWNFKRGDNIHYNLKILRDLHHARSGLKEPRTFNKPITVILVSVIEAILIDLIDRINEGTKHLPAHIDHLVIIEIRKMIEKDKARGNSHRRKMYSFEDIIRVYKKHLLLGSKNKEIYEWLVEFGKMRNRIHIENYYGNYEDDENRVFTDHRLRFLEVVFFAVWGEFVDKYKRPW